MSSFSEYSACVDAAGYHIGQIADIYAAAPYTVNRTDNYVENQYSVSAAFPNHTAEIELKTTPIQGVLTIRSQVSDLWSSQWYEYAHTEPFALSQFSEDQLINYALLFDGENEQPLHIYQDSIEDVM